MRPGFVLATLLDQATMIRQASLYGNNPKIELKTFMICKV